MTNNFSFFCKKGKQHGTYHNVRGYTDFNNHYSSRDGLNPYSKKAPKMVQNKSLMD